MILAANGESMVERMKSTWASSEGVQRMAVGAQIKIVSTNTVHVVLRECNTYNIFHLNKKEKNNTQRIPEVKIK